MKKTTLFMRHDYETMILKHRHELETFALMRHLDPQTKANCDRAVVNYLRYNALVEKVCSETVIHYPSATAYGHYGSTKPSKSTKKRIKEDATK